MEAFKVPSQPVGQYDISQNIRSMIKPHSIDDIFRNLKRPKYSERVVFVFSGGGNRGAAQIGMLYTLMEKEMLPDIILGSSVGALNGVAFACTPTFATVEKLDSLWRGLQKEDVFPPHRFGSTWRYAQRRSHVFPNQGLSDLILSNIEIPDLSETAMPVEIVLTRHSDGVAVRVSSGDALSLLLASSALPGTFPPIEINSELYIDGGIADDVP